MSEGLMAYNNISSGSDTGIVTKTETKTMQANSIQIGSRGGDNHTAAFCTIDNLQSGALAAKLDISYCNISVAKVSSKAYSATLNYHITINSQIYNSPGTSISCGQSGSLSAYSVSFTPPDGASWSIRAELYGSANGGAAVGYPDYVSITSSLITVSVTYIVIQL